MKSETLFNDKESRELDRITIQERGVSGTLLMGFAALSVFKTWETLFHRSSKTIFLCGSGNNGGDGFALAQFLKAEGISVEIYSKAGNFSEETQYYKNITESLKIPTKALQDFTHSQIRSGDLIVDAILGTGFREPLEGEILKVVSEIAKAKEKFGKDCTVLSIDSVSGYIPETKPPFQADILTEIGSPRISNIFYPLEEDKKSFHPIGFLREKFSTTRKSILRATKEELSLRLEREKDSHKYKNGSAIFVGGSEGMSGAILSSALSFQELGGGISQILTPSYSTLVRVLKKDPSFMVADLKNEKDPFRTGFGKKAKVIAIGPGLAKSDIPKFPFPKEAKIILDAGALSLYAEQPFGPNTILTPHLGEWSALVGRSYPNIYSALEDAKDWALQKQCYLLLKGSVSVLFSPKGFSYFWKYQEPKLAVMGTGDLLVGILAFYLSRGEEILEAVGLAESTLLYCARACKGYPTAGRMRKKIRDLVSQEL